MNTSPTQIAKREESHVGEPDIHPNVQYALSEFVLKNPLTIRERLEITTLSELADNQEERLKCTTGRLMGTVPQVPPRHIHGSDNKHRPPIFNLRIRIEKELIKNQLLIITGPPGCGKSTVVPEILLDSCCEMNRRCRMISSQPHRILAHANAECMAARRFESVGQTIGYQIRLESKVSPKTLLTFCTHGVLLRTIYADPGLLSGTTHILIDEIDESELPIADPADSRGGISEGCGLLLSLLPSILGQFPHMKIVLMVNLRRTTYNEMEAIGNKMRKSRKYDRSRHSLLSKTEYGQLSNDFNTIDFDESRNTLHTIHTSPTSIRLEDSATDLAEKLINPALRLSNFFKKASSLTIAYAPSMTQVYYLEDILRWLNYWTPDMQAAQLLISQDAIRCRNFVKWIIQLIEHNISYGVNEASSSLNRPDILQGFSPLSVERNLTLGPSIDPPSSSPTSESMDNLIWLIWKHSMLVPQDETSKRIISECISRAIQFIFSGLTTIDYQHSSIGMTLLMILSTVGHIEGVKKLLTMGADIFVRIALPFELLDSINVKSVIKLELVGPKDNTVSIDDKQYTVFGANSYDLARLFGRQAVADLIKLHFSIQSLDKCRECSEATLRRFGAWLDNDPVLQRSHLRLFDTGSISRKVSPTNQSNLSNKQLLNYYYTAKQMHSSETELDLDLFVACLVKIDSTLPKGTILVFLPSYEEIIMVREILIDRGSSLWKSNLRHLVLVLHSRVQVPDLQCVYETNSNDTRKVILTTSIAEMNMTFDDVVYIVDFGVNYLEQRNYTTSDTFQYVWIGKENAIQRQNCDGRHKRGVCFHLYSRLRFENLRTGDHPLTPSSTLEEACIQARLLADQRTPIEEVLLSVPRPPNASSVRRAIRSLKASLFVGINTCIEN